MRALDVIKSSAPPALYLHMQSALLHAQHLVSCVSSLGREQYVVSLYRAFAYIIIQYIEEVIGSFELSYTRCIYHEMKRFVQVSDRHCSISSTLFDILTFLTVTPHPEIHVKSSEIQVC